MSWFGILMTVVTATGLAGCLTFVVAYAIRSRGAWMGQEAGRFLMAVYANLGALLALVLANQLFGDWPGRRPLTVALFVAYCFEAWWPLRLLTKAQEAARERRAADDKAHPLKPHEEQAEGSA